MKLCPEPGEMSLEILDVVKSEMIMKEEREEEQILENIKQESEDIVVEENMLVYVSDKEGTDEEGLRKFHVCPYENCDRTFSRPWRLASHISYHNGERSYMCQVPGCPKAYFNQSHLRRHVATGHRPLTAERTYVKCPHLGCTMQLSNSSNLKRHCYRSHERKLPYTCEFCDKSFSKHSLLQSHLYRHTGIMCPVCQMVFKSERNLKRHQRTHSTTYKCDFPNCELLFERHAHLLRHVRLNHPSEFTCDVCKKSFKAKCRLEVHMVVHQQSSEREALFCPHANCTRSYYHKRNLMYHIRVRHKRENVAAPEEDASRGDQCAAHGVTGAELFKDAVKVEPDSDVEMLEETLHFVKIKAEHEAITTFKEELKCEVHQ